MRPRDAAGLENGGPHCLQQPPLGADCPDCADDAPAPRLPPRADWRGATRRCGPRGTAAARTMDGAAPLLLRHGHRRANTVRRASHRTTQRHRDLTRAGERWRDTEQKTLRSPGRLTKQVLLRSGRTKCRPAHNTSAASSAATGVRPARRRCATAHTQHNRLSRAPRHRATVATTSHPRRPARARCASRWPRSIGRAHAPSQ